MKNAFIAVFILFATGTFAQKSITWKGGMPGRETCWNEARNWSGHTVPNEFSNVIIPDVSTSTFAFPVIQDGMVEVNALIVASNAMLTLAPNARLVINQQAEGLNQPQLQLKGTLIIQGELMGANQSGVAVHIQKIPISE